MKIKIQSLIVGRVAPNVFRWAYRDQLLLQFILKRVGLDTGFALLDQRVLR